MSSQPSFLRLKKTFRIINWLILDLVFVNTAFYTAYLLRFKGAINPYIFSTYIRLWLYISFTHLIVFAFFQLYIQPDKFSKRRVLINTLKACALAALISVSIVYIMRRPCGFIPSTVFVLAWAFNIILIGGWRTFIRYASR